MKKKTDGIAELVVCLILLAVLVFSCCRLINMTKAQRTMQAELEEVKTQNEEIMFEFKYIYEVIGDFMTDIDKLNTDMKTVKKDCISLNKDVDSIQTDISEIKPNEETNNHYWNNTIITNDAYLYTVQSGDTVSKISNAFGVPVHTIIERNGITDVYNLKIGTTLYIPKD